MDHKISRHSVDGAGRIIRLHRNDDEYRAAIETLKRWREQHILPMDSYFDACKDITNNQKYKGTVIAERLKRLPTIIDKLDRFPHMRLSDMQDIGGVRVILEDIQHLIAFDQEVRELPTLKSSKNYLAKPKSSGYRGRHLVFKQNNMLTEIQLRTRLEHLWATAVETVDVIRGTSMKTKQSDSYWQKFFELASSAFAYMENSPMLPQHQEWDIIRLRKKIQDMMDEYPIVDSLTTYAATYNAIDNHQPEKNLYYAVVTFNSCDNKTTVAYYPEDKHQAAVHKYEELETIPCNNNILVAVNDLKKLHDAYPNYFKDISRFMEMITSMLAFKPKMS